MSKGRTLDAVDINAAWLNRGALAFARTFDPKATGHANHADARCPTCQTDTKNVRVNRGENVVHAHCHRCGIGGDAIGFFKAVRGLRFDVACAELGAIAGLVPGAKPTTIAYNERSPDPTVLDAEKASAIFQALTALFPLTCQPDACKYLASRCILEAAIEDGWGCLPGEIPSLRTFHQGHAIGELVEAGFSREDILRTGLFHQSGERAGEVKWSANRLLIGWKGPSSALTIQRRVIGSDTPKEDRYRFPNGYGAKWPYGADKALASNAKTLAIVEGAPDVLAVRKAFPDLAVIGLQSAGSTLRAEWRDLFVGREVYVALDTDQAGQGATDRLMARALDLGAKSADVWQPPQPHKDWNAALIGGAFATELQREVRCG